MIDFALFLVRDVLEGASKPQRPLVNADRGTSNDDVQVFTVAARHFELDIERKALGRGLIQGDLKVPALDIAQGVHERPGNIERTADDECQKIQRSIGQRHRPFRGIVFPVANTADALDEIQLPTFDAIVAFIGFHPFSPERRRIRSAIGRFAAIKRKWILRHQRDNGARRPAVEYRTLFDLDTGASGNRRPPRVWLGAGDRLRSSPSSPNHHR